jgi:NitT/TauT family transport system ATP-binding protein
MNGLHLLELRDISKSYKKNNQSIWAVRGISFFVDKGDILALVGPSGCGKTTILRMIADLLKPSGGEIRYLDSDISLARKQGLIGYVPQSSSLLPNRTVLENIQLPLEIKKIKAPEHLQEIISTCELDKFINYYPHQLSGGMRQKVAIARALVYKPETILMDEPFAALDEMVKEKLNEELIKIQSVFATTIIYVTHNIEEAVFLSNRIVTVSRSPGMVVKTIDINLPMKRSSALRREPAFFSEVIKVRQALRNL